MLALRSLFKTGPLRDPPALGRCQAESEMAPGYDSDGLSRFRPGGPERLRVFVVMSTDPRIYGGGVLRVTRTLRRIRSAWGLGYVFATPYAAPERTRRSLTRVISPKPASGFPARLLAFLRLCVAIVSRFKPDIVYLVETDKFTLFAGYAAMARGIPIIVEFTTTQVATNWLKRALLRPVLQGSDGIIAIHEDILGEALALGADRGKIWLRDNPVDTIRYTPPPVATARRDDVVEHLMIGGFCDRKNQLFALDVLASLPAHHRLTMVGPAVTPEDDGSYVERVKARAISAALGERVRVVAGFCRDIRPFLWAADTLWLPSTHEGLPNVVLEALCSGLPVVVNRSLNLGAHVQDGVNGENAPLEITAWERAAVDAVALRRKPAGAAAIAGPARVRYDSLTIDRQQYEFFCGVAAATLHDPKLRETAAHG